MTAPDTADKLTAEERDALEFARRSGWSTTQKLVAALDRLAPKPQPPAPRVSELAERWRDLSRAAGGHPDEDAALRDCANELDSAMERWRECVESLLRGRLEQLATHIIAVNQRDRSAEAIAAAITEAFIVDRGLLP